jgi:hypothetical protein
VRFALARALACALWLALSLALAAFARSLRSHARSVDAQRPAADQKSWHPLSYKNQKALWVAEQAAASAADADSRAREEFASEQEYFKCAQLAATSSS